MAELNQNSTEPRKENSISSDSGQNQNVQAEEPASKTNLIDKWKQLSLKKKLLAGFGLTILGLLLVFVIPPARHAALNLTLRSQPAEVLIVNKKTDQPVANAQVKMGSATGVTDENGRVAFDGVRFGAQDISVSKTAYATFEGRFTVDLGVSFFGPVKLEPTGIPLKIKAANIISRQAVKSFEVKLQDGELSADSNEEGVAVLNVPPPANRAVTVEVVAEGFNPGQIKAKLKTGQDEDDPQVAKLTPTGKHYFLSNRTGKVNLVESNLDGSGKKVVVKGTGEEESDTELSVSADGRYGALISTRAGQRGPSGGLLPAVYIVNFQQGTIKRVDEGAPEFDVLGWFNHKFIYEVYYRDYGSPGNHKLKSIDAAANNALKTYTATDTYFSGPTLIQDKLLYSLLNEEKEKFGTFRINLANGKEKRLINSRSYFSKRINSDELLYTSSDNAKYKYSARDDSWTKLKQDKNFQAKSDFTLSDGGKAAWVETRNGQRTLIVENKAVTRDVSVSDILRWHGEDYIIIHSSKDGSTDYIVHVPSQRSLEISDTYQIPPFRPSY